MAFLEKAFELSVVISAVDRFTAPAKRVQSAMKDTQKQIDALRKQLRTLGNDTAGIQKTTDEIEKLAATQKKMESLAASFDKFKKTALVGGAITGIGYEMAKGLAEATDQAGKLLTTLTTIQGATGASGAQMAAIQQQIRNTSSVTKYDNMQVADIAKILATSGYNAQETMALLPEFTKFAEVQEYGKGMNYEESVKQAIELAHGFGKYDPESLNAFLNQFNKATFLQPEDTKEFGETLKYTMTAAKTLGMSDNDILFMAALANRMGLAGSMGGTNAADMLLRAIPGISGGLEPNKAGKYPRQLQAMMEIGLADKYGNSPFFQNGKIVNLQGFIDALYEHTKNLNPEQQARVFHDIFGQQGARVAELFASKTGQDQLKALVEGQGYIKSIDQMQEDYLKTPEGQVNQLKSNLQNLKFNVFLELAKTLTPALEKLNQFVEKLMKFSDMHPNIARWTAEFLLFGTALALVSGPLLNIIGLIGMLRRGIALLRMTKAAEGGAGIAGDLVKAESAAGARGLGGLLGRGARGAGRLLGRGLRGAGIIGTVADVGLGAYDLYSTARQTGWRNAVSTQGGAVAGSVVGGIAGAALGSLVGPVGTAVGGMAGSWLGGKLGGWLDSGGITKKLVDGTINEWNRLKTQSSSAWNSIKLSASNAIKGIGDFFSNLPQKAAYAVGYTIGWFVSLPGRLAALAKQTADNVATWFGNMYQRAVQWASQTIQGVQQWWSSLPTRISEWWASLPGTVDKIWKDIYTSITNWASNAAHDVENWFSSLPGKIKGWFGDADSWLSNLGQRARDFMSNIGSGFRAGYQAAVTPHATGGIFGTPHIGLVAESGPEAIIPLANRSRGLDLWAQAGRMLGVGPGGVTNNIVVQIYAQPNHNEEQIADAVIRKLGALSRRMSMNSGMRVNIGAV